MDFDHSWNMMTMQGDYLAGRTALITGGTRGIGFAMAKQFLQNGASVVITGLTDAEVSDAAANLTAYVRKGCVLDGVVMDNLKVELFEECFAKACRLIGDHKFDILVNNAGINGSGTFGEVTPEMFDTVIGVNLKGTFFVSQMLANYMVRNGIRGNILNVGSSSSLRPAVTPYTLSKWGVRALTVGMAKTLIPHGIVVNAVAPGPTATSMMAVNGYDGTSLDFEQVPTGRYITAEEIANAATFLVSNMGRMIVGDMVYITGGPGVTTFDDLKYEMPK